MKRSEGEVRPVRKVTGSLALVAALVGGTIAGALPASAASRTAVYACGMSGLWVCPSVRPGEIAFGARYDVARLRWSTWSSGIAYGRGHYYGFGSYNARVKLYDVKTHHGRRYFAWIKITAAGHRTRYLSYNGYWRTR
jgi:hypothetical protein